MEIEVSDLYDAFFQIADVFWHFGEFAASEAARTIYVGPDFSQLCDELEFDFFFAACARRVADVAGKRLPPVEVRQHLRLHDTNGSMFNEPYQCQYLHHAIDWGTPQDRDVENRVAAGDLTPRSREDTRIFFHLDALESDEENKNDH
jgi:hypothetical protein